MKIVIISDDFPPRSYGGAGIIASMQAQEFTKRGHDVTVITSVQETGLEEKSVQNGLTIHRICLNYRSIWRAYISLYNPRAVPKVRKILEDTKPDVIYVHNIHLFLSYHVLSLARQYGKKVFFVAHDTMTVHVGKICPTMTRTKQGKRIFDYRVSLWREFREYGLRWNPFRAVIRRYLRNADMLFAVSSALADALRQNGMQDVVVLHNGINVERFTASQENIDQFRERYNLNGKRVMFFGGRISGAKGGEVALLLLIEVSKIVPEACLFIVGHEDAYVKKLMQKARNAGVGDKIISTGIWLNREEIIPAYYASDVVLSLSVYMDPFPTINLEAMAARKPIIGTCFGGTPEAVVDNVNGFIIDPNDLKSVVNRTANILTDDRLAKKFGQAGYERVLNHFNLSRKIDELEYYMR